MTFLKKLLHKVGDVDICLKCPILDLPLILSLIDQEKVRLIKEALKDSHAQNALNACNYLLLLLLEFTVFLIIIILQFYYIIVFLRG